jgi:hypothetical protein
LSFICIDRERHPEEHHEPAERQNQQGAQAEDEGLTTLFDGLCKFMVQNHFTNNFIVFSRCLQMQKQK